MVAIPNQGATMPQNSMARKELKKKPPTAVGIAK
jgi:hypothetical protein